LGQGLQRCVGRLDYSGFSPLLLFWGFLGLSAWLTFVRPEPLQFASAAAAKTVCSNVFIAKRDVDAILRTDLLAFHPIFRLMKTDVSVVD
jgi:hypothetical protein